MPVRFSADITKGNSAVFASVSTKAASVGEDYGNQIDEECCDDVPRASDNTRPISSLVGTLETVAKVAKQQVHYGLQEEDDGPPVRSVALDGKSFYTRRVSLPKTEQIGLLFKGAGDDIKERKIFSPYEADRVLNYFDGVISFVSVFLYEELGWKRTLRVREDPTPVLLSLLCYFHICVYWLNMHHFLKFSPNIISLPQLWCILIFSLCLVLYPLSLGAWIEKESNDAYYFINTGGTFIGAIFCLLTKVDESANSLFVLWQKGASGVAAIYYGIATILKCVVKWEGSDYLLYIAPFFFVVPLGAQSKPEKNCHIGEDTMANHNIFRRAFREFRRGNILSPYPIGRALDFFDSVVGLATIFIFLDVGWAVFDDSNVKGLLAALLCYTHVMGYWLNVHHNLKFSPKTLSVLQVWCLVFFALGMVFYPLAISAWIEEGSVEIYYIVNLALCGFMVIFSFLTKIEPGKSRILYRWWHKSAPVIALVWYTIAYVLHKAGNGQLWMLIVAPFLQLIPLGGEKEGPPVCKEHLHNKNGSYDNDAGIESFRDNGEDVHELFDCQEITSSDHPHYNLDV